jgi:glycosyltransferase involved in cell wall biosynthesis
MSGIVSATRGIPKWGFEQTNLEGWDPMKILMIAPQPFFEPRGTPISVYQRLQALSALRYQVDLLTYHVGENVSIPGVRVYRCLNVPFIKKVKLGPSWPKAFLDILLFFQSIVLLARNRYDVIHSHEEAAFWSVLLAKVFSARHVYDMHSCLPQQLASVPRWDLRPFIKVFDLLERWVINTCEVVITIGLDLEDHVKRINPKVRTVLIQNLPIRIQDAGPDHSSAQQLREKARLDGRLPVVYTGSFERYQGLDLLLESARIVQERCPEVSFIMVGGAPRQVERWRDQASAFGLQEAMAFTGAVPLAEALAYLELAEILVSPRTEGTSVPLKIYSYLHAGKPIVATDVLAHLQVLNCEMAMLVAPTVEAFADGIVKLAQSPALRESLGLRAQQFAAERFNPADYLAKLDWVYQQPSTATPAEPAVHSPEADRAHASVQRFLRLP